MIRPIWKRTLSAAVAIATSGCVSWTSLAGQGLAPLYSQPQGQPQSAQPAQPAPPSGAAPAPAPGTVDVTHATWAAAAFAPMMLMMAFHPMGLPFGGAELRPGEYVRWQLGDGTDRDMPAFIERARLIDDNGNQVWRVKYGVRTGEHVTIEGIVSPNGQVVRLRAKYMGDTVASDISVQSAQSVMAMNQQNLTPEQIGATDAGMENVTVPAGTFNAHHYVFSRGNGSIEWWFADNVPGGILKLTARNQNERKMNVGLIQVEAYGQNAVSEF